MAATLTMETCSFCKGSGQAESLEEKGFDGEWHPHKTLDHAIADAWIANPPPGGDILRWTSCPCPICHGDGHYEVEYIPCKIF